MDYIFAREMCSQQAFGINLGNRYTYSVINALTALYSPEKDPDLIITTETLVKDLWGWEEYILNEEKSWEKTVLLKQKLR